MTTKKLFFTILFSLTVAYASAQQGITLRDATKEGIGSNELDKTYVSALSTVETTATGEKKDEVLLTAWRKLSQDLGAFLKKNDFEWKEDARCMNKVYFTPEGKITYFLYDVPSLDENNKQNLKDCSTFSSKIILLVTPQKSNLRNVDQQNSRAAL